MQRKTREIGGLPENTEETSENMANTDTEIDRGPPNVPLLGVSTGRGLPTVKTRTIRTVLTVASLEQMGIEAEAEAEAVAVAISLAMSCRSAVKMDA